MTGAPDTLKILKEAEVKKITLQFLVYSLKSFNFITNYNFSLDLKKSEIWYRWAELELL